MTFNGQCEHSLVYILGAFLMVSTSAYVTVKNIYDEPYCAISHVCS